MSGPSLEALEHAGGERTACRWRRWRSARGVAGALGAPVAWSCSDDGGRRGELGAYGVRVAHVARTAAGRLRPGGLGRGVAQICRASPAAVAGRRERPRQRGHGVLPRGSGLPMAANVLEVTSGRPVPADPPALGRQPARGRAARWPGPPADGRAARRRRRRAAGAAGPEPWSRFEPGPGRRGPPRAGRRAANPGPGRDRPGGRAGGGRRRARRGRTAGFAELEDLAGLLGAAVGVSRAVTSAGWRPHAEQIGQTGQRIAPELYIACGISGAIQHIVGCKAAKRDPGHQHRPRGADHGRATYAVIGDLHAVVPAVSAEIGQASRRRTGKPGVSWASATGRRRCKHPCDAAGCCSANRREQRGTLDR